MDISGKLSSIEKRRKRGRAAAERRRRRNGQLLMSEYRDRIAAEKAARQAQRAQEREQAAKARKAEREAAKKAAAADRKKRQREAQKAWRLANRDRMRELMRNWRRNNPDKVRKDKRGRNGKSNARRREYFLKVQGGLCAYCKCKLMPGKMHLDHIMPRALGGSNSRSNIQLLCEACNLSKGAQHPVDYAQSIGRLI